MSGNVEIRVNPDATLETLAAELALAAHRVALRTRTQGTWLDLELDIWRRLRLRGPDVGKEGIVSVPIARDAPTFVSLSTGRIPTQAATYERIPDEPALDAAVDVNPTLAAQASVCSHVEPQPVTHGAPFQEPARRLGQVPAPSLLAPLGHLRLKRSWRVCR